MFGATDQQLEEAREAYRQRQESSTFEVWPENWRAFELFVALETQWDVALGPTGLYFHGIRYGSLAEVERRLAPRPGDDVPDDRTVFEQLQLLEREARRHLNSKG